MSEMPIYFDYQASTPVDPRVVESMMPYYSTHYGNSSSSSHSFVANLDNECV